MPTTTAQPKSKVQLEAESLLREAAKATGPLPLDYGHPQPLHQTVSNNTNAWIDRVGGWRQFGFALGLSLTLGGFAYAVAHSPRQWDASIYTALGGLLIGFALPLRQPRSGDRK